MAYDPDSTADTVFKQRLRRELIEAWKKSRRHSLKKDKLDNDLRNAYVVGWLMQTASIDLDEVDQLDREWSREESSVCSHRGAHGPCMASVRDGKCIWCRREMQPAEARK